MSAMPLWRLQHGPKVCQLLVPGNVHIPIWADAKCLSDRTKPELNKHLRHSYCSPFFLFAWLKCNSDVSAESLSHVVQFLSLSPSLPFFLFSLSPYCSFCSLCCSFIEQDIAARGEKKRKRWHFLSCPSCPLWSACHFGSSVVTAASTAEQCAEQLTVKSL